MTTEQKEAMKQAIVNGVASHPALNGLPDNSAVRDAVAQMMDAELAKV